MAKSYQEFLANIGPMQAEVIAYLDQQFTTIEGVARKMRYSIPFYDYNSWICYLNPLKSSGVELCFLEGVKMTESFPILDLKGRKMASGLSIDVNDDLPIDLILDMINHAISLNN